MLPHLEGIEFLWKDLQRVRRGSIWMKRKDLHQIVKRETNHKKRKLYSNNNNLLVWTIVLNKEFIIMKVKEKKCWNNYQDLSIWNMLNINHKIIQQRVREELQLLINCHLKRVEEWFHKLKHNNLIKDISSSLLWKDLKLILYLNF